MSIEVACHCGKRFRVKDEHAGRRGKCPACGGMVVVPAPAAEAPAADLDFVEPTAETKVKACPSCGGIVSSFAIVCEHCKANLKTPVAKSGKARQTVAARSDKPPGSPALGIALGLGIGLVVAFASAWAYAYIDLIFPLWSILITLVFGALLGYVPSLMMVAGGLRNRKIGFPIVAVIVAIGYWMTWAVWIHAALNRKGDGPAVGFLLTNPSELTSWIATINDVGIWSYGGGGTAVHGTALTIVWLGEATIILGAAITAAWTTLEDDLPG